MNPVAAPADDTNLAETKELRPEPPAKEHAPAPSPAKPSSARKWLFLAIGAAVLSLAGFWAWPMISKALNTVSTDDAYVNGHATFVAPRISGQVAMVHVDDNERVKKGDVLVSLDKEPYELQVSIKKAALTAAEADLAASQAQVQGAAAQARGNRFNLEHAIENVKNQLALLRSNVAELKVEEANLQLAQRDYARSKPLVEKGAATQQELDEYEAKLDVARSRVIRAQEMIQQTRVSLGLPINRENPLDVPENLDQTYSLVKQALGQLIQSAAAIGYFGKSWNATPQEALAEFYKQDPKGDLDTIYAKLLKEAPVVMQAHSKVEQAKRDVAKAELDLRYCDIVSEIDGVVTRRNVNPGNNVQAGQSLMVVRSLTEIWIDANFKETQLAQLRIGQRVECEVDMYGAKKTFEGRITGFTMGTGQTLSLLPAQNATGNFVKIVQRLPVKIELTDYQPGETPLFVGLSVTPYVHYKEPPSGKNAGAFLQSLGAP